MIRRYHYFTIPNNFFSADLKSLVIIFNFCLLQLSPFDLHHLKFMIDVIFKKVSISKNEHVNPICKTKQILFLLCADYICYLTIYLFKQLSLQLRMNDRTVNRFLSDSEDSDSDIVPLSDEELLGL